jgi:hypothetical protein
MAVPMTEDRRAELWQGRDHNGTRSIWAVLLADGRLRIEGQDLGPGVAIWGEGFTEYEWDWTVAPADVPRVVEVLGGTDDDDPLELLARWSRESGGRDPGQHLKSAGIALEFWSRVGD